MIKLKDTINEAQNIPKVGDFFDMREDSDFEIVPIIRVNNREKWIDMKHPDGHNHRIDFWNIEAGGFKGTKKIWKSRVNDKA